MINHIPNYSLWESVYLVWWAGEYIIDEVILAITWVRYKIREKGAPEYLLMDESRLTNRAPSKIGFKTN